MIIITSLCCRLNGRMAHLHVNSITLPRTNKKINDNTKWYKQVIQINVRFSLVNCRLSGQWQHLLRTFLLGLTHFGFATNKESHIQSWRLFLNVKMPIIISIYARDRLNAPWLFRCRCITNQKSFQLWIGRDHVNHFN